MWISWPQLRCCTRTVQANTYNCPVWSSGGVRVTRGQVGKSRRRPRLVARLQENGKKRQKWGLGRDFFLREPLYLYSATGVRPAVFRCMRSCRDSWGSVVSPLATMLRRYGCNGLGYDSMAWVDKLDSRQEEIQDHPILVFGSPVSAQISLLLDFPCWGGCSLHDLQ